MAQNETWLNHDMLEAVRVQYLDGNLFSMDNAGNLIGVNLTRGGVDYSGGGSVSSNVIRADGSTVSVVGALSGNVATVVLPQAAYAVPGVASIVVKLTVSGEVTTIAAVVANVYLSSTDSVVDPGTIIPSVQALISAIESAVASIPADYSALWASLAPAFSTSTNYTAGQYVTYNGALYRFTTDHSAGSWNSAQVTATNIGADLNALTSALDNQLVEIDFAPALSTDRKILPSSGKSSTDVKYTRTGVVQAAKGERAAVGLVSDTYEFAVFYYGVNGSISTGEDYLHRYTEYINGIVLFPDDVANFGLSFRRKDNADLTSADRDAIKAAVKAYMYTDTTLTMKNYPADAKAVQDAFTAEGIVTEAKIGNVSGVSFSSSQGLAGCYFETDGNAYLYVKALNTWYLRGAVATSASYGDILTVSKETSPSGVADCIKLASNDAVVYDVSDSTWKVVSLTNTFSSSYIPIFVCGYYKAYKQFGVVKGIGQYLYIAYMAQENETSYSTEVDTVVRKVLADRDNKTITFGLITDSHHGQKISGTSVNYNAIAQVDIFNRTCEKCADFTVHLGDAIGGMKALSVNTGYLTEYSESQNDTFLPFMYTIGHHEMYGLNYSTEYLNDPTAIPMANVLGAMGKRKFISPVYSESGDNWYFDLDGIRFISIDSVHNSSNGFNDEAKTFLQTAVNTANKIIVFSHLPANAGVNWNKRSPNSGSAIESTLNGATAEVLAYLHGHTHWDNSVVVTGNSFPYIATCCAFAEKTDSSKFCDLGNPTVYDRVIGDYSEFCFDIVNVHSDTGTIKHFRFGVGNDRTYTQPT